MQHQREQFVELKPVTLDARHESDWPAAMVFMDCLHVFATVSLIRVLQLSPDSFNNTSCACVISTEHTKPVIATRNQNFQLRLPWFDRATPSWLQAQLVDLLMKPETQIPISVCMIAGAEEHRIRRSLESVAGWASEIIVVMNDDVSDRTEQIATELGAKVFREPWKGYIAQKNSAAEKATQGWLFGLDADEVVTPELQDELLALFARGAKLSCDAYSVPRLTLYCGRWLRHGDWYPDRKTRLWRRGTAQWGGKNPHDKLVVNGSIGKLRGDLQHYSMDDLEHHARKALAYGTLFAKQYPADGSRIGLFGLWLRPAWRFVRSYFVRRGFLDGWQGFTVAKMIAFETFIRYAKVREIQQQKDSNP